MAASVVPCRVYAQLHLLVVQYSSRRRGGEGLYALSDAPVARMGPSCGEEDFAADDE